MSYLHLPYFFGYKTEFFPIQNKLKDLDLSCMMDPDLWGCLGRAKTRIIEKFHGTELDI